jgi:type III secretory pathway component EscR
METSFTTKEESKVKQQADFLKRSSSERVESFFRMIIAMKKFPTKAEDEKKDNIVIVINTQK